VNRFLLDIGLPLRSAEDLRRDGFSVEHAGERGLNRTSDRDLLLLCAAEGMIAVSLDHDFAQILATESWEKPSLIHLRLSHLDRDATTELLRRLIPILDKDLRQGCIATVTATGIRIRPLPVFPSLPPA
jgi:predicted nuclease of predicted toxin-antitoxin system